MYEKLNVEKAERIKKKQNTHRGGKVSLEYGVIFSLSSLVSKTSIWNSSWGRMGFISVSPCSAVLLCGVTVLPPSTFSASIIGPHSVDRFLGQRLAHSLAPGGAHHHVPTHVFRRSKHTHVCVAADLSPPRGSWPVIWQRLTIAGEERRFQGQTDGQTKWLRIRTTLPAHRGGLRFWLSGHRVFRLAAKTQEVGHQREGCLGFRMLVLNPYAFLWRPAGRTAASPWGNEILKRL